MLNNIVTDADEEIPDVESRNNQKLSITSLYHSTFFLSLFHPKSYVFPYT